MVGQIYKLPGSCFDSQNGEITSLTLETERKNINRCLGGLRIEDQGVQISQNLSGEEFFFPSTAAKT